jgi:hypothetical protein
MDRVTHLPPVGVAESVTRSSRKTIGSLGVDSSNRRSDPRRIRSFVDIRSYERAILARLGVAAE